MVPRLRTRVSSRRTNQPDQRPPSGCEAGERLMPDGKYESLLHALLDSWDRNNAILINLLRAIPEGGLELRATDGSPSVAQLFAHIHYVRLVLVFEDAPEFSPHEPTMNGWQSRIALEWRKS